LSGTPVQLTVTGAAQVFFNGEHLKLLKHATPISKSVLLTNWSKFTWVNTPNNKPEHIRMVDTVEG
jgi:hypothetical protein